MSAISNLDKSLLPQEALNTSHMNSAPPGLHKTLQSEQFTAEPFYDFNNTAREKEFYRT